MREKEGLRISEYDNLSEAKEFIWGWKEIESFNISALSEDELIALDKFSGLEVLIPNSLIEGEVISCILSLNKVLEDLNGYFFIREIEQVVSKMRSYRGIVKSLKDDTINFFEKEYLTGSDSFFASLVDLDTITPQVLLDRLFDASYNFIIWREGVFDKEDFVDNVGTNFYENFGFNYSKFIVKEMIERNPILLRIGGDHGKSYYSLQFFVRKDLKEYLKNRLILN